MSESINRSIARVAARNAFRQSLSSNEQLLDEARMTDRFSCSDQEMLALVRAELARVQGQSKGGIVSGVRRKYSIARTSNKTTEGHMNG